MRRRYSLLPLLVTFLMVLPPPTVIQARTGTAPLPRSLLVEMRRTAREDRNPFDAKIRKVYRASAQDRQIAEGLLKSLVKQSDVIRKDVRTAVDSHSFFYFSPVTGDPRSQIESSLKSAFGKNAGGIQNCVFNLMKARYGDRVFQRGIPSVSNRPIRGFCPKVAKGKDALVFIQAVAIPKKYLKFAFDPTASPLGGDLLARLSDEGSTNKFSIVADIPPTSPLTAAFVVGMVVGGGLIAWWAEIAEALDDDEDDADAEEEVATGGDDTEEESDLPDDEETASSGTGSSSSSGTSSSGLTAEDRAVLCAASDAAGEPQGACHPCNSNRPSTCDQGRGMVESQEE